METKDREPHARKEKKETAQLDTNNITSSCQKEDKNRK